MILQIASCTTPPNKSNDSIIKAIDETTSDTLYLKGIDSYYKTLDDIAYLYLNRSLSSVHAFKDSFITANTYYHLAKIDYHHTNYISAEEKAITALNYIPKTDKGQILKYRVYSTLGTIAKEQNDYSEAILYYNKHFSYYRHNKNKREAIRFYNNIGRLFYKEGKYNKAIKYYDSIISVDGISSRFPIQYARAISNKAMSLSKIGHNTKNIFELLKHALDIRIQFEDLPGQVNSHISLSKYFLDNNQIDKAKDHALIGKQIADKIKDTEAVLELYKILAQTDHNNSNTYFFRYAHLKDSLLKIERLFKKQAAKIQYNVEQNEKKLILQKKKLKSRNKALIWGGTFLLLALISSFVFYNQKTKISKQNRQIIALQKEVHHHAKNDLERVNSFLIELMQNSKNPILKDLQYRIVAMINLHTLLYTSSNNEQVIIQDYFEILIPAIHTAYTTNDKEINYTINAKINLPAKKAQHVGLLITELVINIYKHAFVSKESGQYEITMKNSNTYFTLIIEDNGIGFPLGFDIENTASYGMEFVNDICEQEDFDLKIENKDKGSKIIIRENAS